jgi:succinyl-diaminopimelate desuccinylase
MSLPPPSADAIRDLAWADHSSVIALIQELVRMPTRGGIDPYNRIIDYVTQWLCNRGMPARRLHETEDGHAVAVVCDIVGEGRGPTSTQVTSAASSATLVIVTQHVMLTAS